eukprot:CAMPEP_0117431584 /NCGR_PEP_ID=MMETSP0758-20121206/11107_1 /TAXON_ID=63605 /ORGANISM="Percolomonas cosmopolitus, Strain AE-1 (ATCC 50343)" /LENGTH=69 /DNA_ID=CAMNT_0005220717 /DNA_START=61 /DNA_END=267 /DNA_ORIENTATION=+
MTPQPSSQKTPPKQMPNIQVEQPSPNNSKVGDFSMLEERIKQLESAAQQKEKIQTGGPNQLKQYASILE